MKKYSPIIVFLILIVLGFGIHQYNKPKLRVDIPNEVKVDEPFFFQINGSKQQHALNFDKVQIYFYHKYKKDEIIDETISSYQKGKYKLVYFPQYSGEYLGTVKAIIGDETIIKQFNVIVK